MRFYSPLFAAGPTVVKDDYVKWMLDADPAGVAWEAFLTHDQTTMYDISRAIRELGEAAEWRPRLWASASPVVAACSAA